MDSNRHYAELYTKYKQYFNILYSKINEYNVELENTYNIDEKGFIIGVISRLKRVFNKHKKGFTIRACQDGSREWVSLLAAICADGTALPPSIIFASKNSTL
ncbi:uncharacterized protein M421DRAFT_77728 [Didymella exigua CBS 183.55]|uniref:DDE-1 domain-containing protein n=1 Tax=Didymella exigua CBS 183.55 TaxID=1150837 RepID=A0A6A5R796_9PLEO|nr:uncharacterized protein M421DRAFT_77728 [Didymella exigua CBS 183.55]KAF1922586.1 hypothetical protein M421DRAFT_77728 [Didymella exigua CBS 183.55]